MVEVDEFDQEVAQGSSRRSLGSRLTRSPLVLGAGLIVLVVVGYLFFKPAPPANLSPDPDVIANQKKEAAREKAKRAKYAVLFNQLPQTNVPEVLRELSRQGISFKQTQTGKNAQIEVEEDRLEEAKMLLASKGIPSGTPEGYALLDSGETMGVTDFDKRVRYVRALEGEIEKSIKQIDQIDNCKAKVVLPEQRLFAVTQPPVTAAILLTAKDGKEITDSMVFSIIQYVASAVENLQPENVTVVDSKGRNLSEGIFDRVSDGNMKPVTALVPSANPKPVQEVPNPENIRPIAPNPEELTRWYDMKQKMEEELINRATKQLVGILPLGSFKVAISVDLGPIQGGVVIRRITTSIVVDNNRDDIDLNSDSKNQIFNTVAGSIGYVRQRDIIVLNRADFSIMTPTERRMLEAQLAAKKNVKYWLIGGGGVILAGLTTMGLVRMIRRRRRFGSDDDLGLTGRDGDMFGDLQSEIDSERQYEPIRELSYTDPDLLAGVVEQWLREDGS